MTTACLIIIGNEILSGRTKDVNLNWLAVELNKVGVKLCEARVIADIPQAIIATLNECRKNYDYVFTTGGIGPTHDDITSENIAAALGVAYEKNPAAEAILAKHYGEENLNAARLKMSYMPVGAELILNPVSAAPGFRIENIYVMAGVPRIMQAMFDNIKHTLQGGEPVLSKTVSIFMTEGIIAEGLTKIQNDFPHVEIGSYPFVRNNRLGTSLVARNKDATELEKVGTVIQEFILGLGGEIDNTEEQ